MDENERKKILDESLRRYLVMQGVLREGDPLPEPNQERMKRNQAFFKEMQEKAAKPPRTEK